VTTSARHEPIVHASTIWPPERFYWSVIDAPAGMRVRSGPLPVGLRPAFEEEVPEPWSEELDSENTVRRLHAVCRGMGHGTVIVCAVPVGELKALNPSVQMLCPGRLPEFIRDQVFAAETDPQAVENRAAEFAGSLNLLVGDLEPSPARAARAHRRTVLLLGVLLCLALGAVGLDRRAGHFRTQAQLMATLADEDARNLGQRLQTPVRVTTERLPVLLAVAQRTAEAASRISGPSDATLPLAALLEHWPVNPPAPANSDAPGVADGSWSCDVQSLTVNGESIALTLSIDGDAAAFLRELRPPAGWMLDEPRLSNVGRAAATSRRHKASGTESPPSPVAVTRVALAMRRSPVSTKAAPLAAGGNAP
jgi:hypothetical protein